MLFEIPVKRGEIVIADISAYRGQLISLFYVFTRLFYPAAVEMMIKGVPRFG